MLQPCEYRGEATGETVHCKTCGGGVKLKLYGCKVFGECTLGKKVDGIGCCKGCTAMPRSAVHWAYGVTTVPSRRAELLPQTLASLKAAGFDAPRLFVDSCDDPRSWEREFGLSVTPRWPAIRLWGNWTLALGELYLRNPKATRFAIFQDDIVACRDLRAYLERCTYPERGYWNLITYPMNQKPALGWAEASRKRRGLGAQGLVFSRDAVITLLTNNHAVQRSLDKDQGWRKIDGGVVHALNSAGWLEYCHNPSLIRHTGDVSSFGNGKQPRDLSFRGEGWSALEMLGGSPRASSLQPVSAGR